MEGEEREEAVGSACTYSRGVEGFFNDVTRTKCIGGAPTLPDYTSQSSSLPTSSEDCCFGKRVKIEVILSDEGQAFKPQSMSHR